MLKSLNKFLVLPLLLLAVTACTVMDGKTPTQRLYGAVADYERIQEVAIAYKNRCNNPALNVDQDCQKYVEKAKEVDKRATALINTIKVGGGGVEYTETLQSALLLLISEMSQYLVDAGWQKEIEASKEAVPEPSL